MFMAIIYHADCDLIPDLSLFVVESWFSLQSTAGATAGYIFNY